jgi:hypothetical protein
MDNIWFLKKKIIISIRQVIYVDSKVKIWQIGLNHGFHRLPTSTQRYLWWVYHVDHFKKLNTHVGLTPFNPFHSNAWIQNLLCAQIFIVWTTLCCHQILAPTPDIISKIHNQASLSLEIARMYDSDVFSGTCWP